MVHAQKTVRARGIVPGRDFQRAMEQVAIDHYNNFGRIEGRQLDGVTSTRSLQAQPKFNEPSEFITGVSFKKIDLCQALLFGTLLWLYKPSI